MDINEGAICAMMADVYMWKKDYANAIIWINNLFKAKSPTGLYIQVQQVHSYNLALHGKLFSPHLQQASKVSGISIGIIQRMVVRA
jgi:hypothetical protein